MITVSAINASEVVVRGPAALKEWRERYRLPVPGHEHNPRFKKGWWDGYVNTGKWCKLRGDHYELRCSRGLVPRIVRDLGIDVRFNFSGVTPQEIEEFCSGNPQVARLRDYQLRAFKTVLAEGWGRVAFATNAGKGAVIALLAAFAAQRGHRALILCDELAVFDALYGELREWGRLEPGLLRRGVTLPPTESVVLGMTPTLHRRLAAEADEEGNHSGPWTFWLESLRMVLVDEADKANAPTWRALLDMAVNTTWRGGFSGTFSKELFYDVRMDELMGPIVDRVTNMEMVERGVSARPNVEVHGFDATASLTFSNRDFFRERGPGKRNLVYQHAVIGNFDRHHFVASLIHPDTPTAIVVNRIEHGQLLSEAIPGSVFLDGSVPDAERIQALEEFRQGAIRIIIVTKILDRGTNRLGHAADLIFASGEGSTAQTLQRIGRGLRRAGGKEFLRLVDIADRVRQDIWSDRKVKAAATFLHGAVRRRIQVYSDQGFDIEIHK